MLVDSGDSLAICLVETLFVLYYMDFSFADGLMEVFGVSIHVPILRYLYYRGLVAVRD